MELGAGSYHRRDPGLIKRRLQRLVGAMLISETRHSARYRVGRSKTGLNQMHKADTPRPGEISFLALQECDEGSRSFQDDNCGFSPPHFLINLSQVKPSDWIHVA